MTLTKTWATNNNYYTITDATNTNRTKKTFHGIYRSFLDYLIPTGGWTLLGSSNGTNGALDAVDRIGSTYTAANILYNNPGSAHSWIAYRSPAAIGSVSLLISLNTNGGNIISYYLTYGSLSGGSATADPTLPTPNISLASTAASAYNYATPNTQLHVTYSTQGDFFLGQNPVGSTFFNGAFGVTSLTDIRGSDGYTTVMYLAMNANVNTLTNTNYYDLWYGIASDNTSNIVLNALRPLSGSDSTDIQDGFTTDFTTSVNMSYPLYLYCNAAGYKTLKGKLVDYEINFAQATGNLQPASGPFEKLSVGPYWIPFSAAPTW